MNRPVPARWLAAFALGLLLPGLRIAHAAEAEPVPSFRLGDAAAPLDYDLRLAIDPAATRFAGEIRIHLRFARETRVLWLAAVGLDIDRAEVSQGERRIAARIVPGGEQFVGLEADGTPFAPGDAVAVIAYRGPLQPLATRGLFRQRESGDWYVLSQFEPTSARRAFPCFDEPQWKTPWRVTIDAPVADLVTSNMPEEVATTLEAPTGWRRHVFAVSKPLPSYLVALAVGPFDRVAGGRAGAAATPLGYLAPRGRGPELAAARESTPALLAILEEYFGTPYPFPKLDTVPIPSTLNFGAMENAGMITYRESLMLARPYEDTEVFRRRYASVAAHEMAHQWSGDLVTLAWWDDTWLNEAFATWMSRKAVGKYRPDWERGWSGGQSRRRALEADRLASARSIHNPVLAETDIAGAFDAITYDKGAGVLAMFEAWLGPDAFRAGVRGYLAKHAYGSATSHDFFAALGEASGRPGQALGAFRAFVDQPGAPELDVRLRCDGDAPAIEVSQHRFRPVGSTAAELQWMTPACFRYAADGVLHRQCVEVENGMHRFALAQAKSCPDWLLANADGAGHYLARYDDDLAARIAERFAQIPEEEAIAFAGDAGLLARSGLLPVDAAFRLAAMFLHHPAPGVEQGAVALINALPDDRLAPRERDAKRDLVAREILPLARRVGWVERPDDAQALRELRVALMPLAARYEDRETLRMHARELALRWLARRESVAGTMVDAVLRTAGRFADAPMYARLEGALAATRDRHDRREMAGALARVRDPALRERMLALTLDPRLDGGEAYFLLVDALEDEANRASAFDFLRAHFDALVAKLPPDSAARLATPLGELCTPEARATFVSFYRDRAPSFLGGAKRYAQALESIDLCIAATFAAASK
jgi:cytosol alanyl aminopeptidase